MHSKNSMALTQCGLGPRFDPASGDHVIHLFADFPLFLFFLLYQSHSDLDCSLSCMNSFEVDKAGSHDSCFSQRFAQNIPRGKRFRLYGAV